GRGRHLRRTPLRGPRRELRARHGLALLAAAARQRLGQLHEGRAARAGARAPRRRARRRAAPGHERVRQGRRRQLTPEREEPAMPSQVTGSKVAITLVAMGGALMAFIDISIVNVALSDMRASFGTPLDQIGWVSTGYMMANIVVIPMTGWFQRR